MNKLGRVVILIVIISLILGGLCVGVGFMTGAEPDRIYQVVDNRYHLTENYDFIHGRITENNVVESIQNIWNS